MATADYILFCVRNSFDVPPNHSLAIDTLNERTFIAVETTSEGSHSYYHGQHTAGSVTAGEPVDLSIEGMRAYDKMLKLVENAKAGRDSRGQAHVLDPADHPDLFKPGFKTLSLYGLAHEPAMRALHALQDLLMHEGLQLRLQMKGIQKNYHVWLAPSDQRMGG